MHFYQSVELDLSLIFKVILAGVFFGMVSDLVVTMVSWMHHHIKSISLHPYLKAFLGGIILVILAIIFGTQYLGLGLDTIENTLDSNPAYTQNLPWYAFILKSLFTSLTLGVGGSGGIITALFYIGATSP